MFYVGSFRKIRWFGDTITARSHAMIPAHAVIQKSWAQKNYIA